ncbi:hypothetical protein FPV16_05825 [Methylobacterium sp. W2]|uniref:hypothetical protein n=1 Tax=Methylobacterium sp. W2 TaxID=2598107 RepID=UPI001D0C7218|nr:hypothetical protein [Methylobacterium sp. W2]MCC0805745.1 hypothetical protein [Methylobacterium sp. W2]
MPLPTQRRAAMRRALARHRPRSQPWSRIGRDRKDVRLSDVLLALLGLTMLGALGLVAGAALLGGALAP